MTNSRYPSLEAYLQDGPLDVDGRLDDGGGAVFGLKGRELEATVLFADVAGFTSRTVDLSPVETLAFVNNYISWVTHEALRDRPGVIDKYVGDEIMVVFSKELGSADLFLDAVQAARRMGEYDPLGFYPHMGLASGPVVVGYLGTSQHRSVAVFGAPVALAARCAGYRPENGPENYSALVSFPDAEWSGRRFAEVFPADNYGHPWEEVPAAPWTPKNLAEIQVRSIVKTAFWIPSPGADASTRAREGVEWLRSVGHYRSPEGTVTPE